MPKVFRYIGKSPLNVMGRVIDPGSLIQFDNLSEEAKKIIEGKLGKDVRRVKEREFSAIKEIMDTLKHPTLAYDYAEIRGAIIKEADEKGSTSFEEKIWNAYLIKILLKRREGNEETTTSFTPLLERPNFLIFKKHVDIRSLDAIIQSLMAAGRFKLDNYTVYSRNGHFEKDYSCQSSWGERFKLNWSSEVYSYKVGNKPSMPEKPDLKSDAFRDFCHAIRELLELGDFEYNFYSNESMILIFPYYFAKISKCEMQGKKLIVDIETYDKDTALNELKCKYNYVKSPASQLLGDEKGKKEGRGEISPLAWHNEIELPVLPSYSDVYLLYSVFEEPVDEYRVAEKIETPTSRGFDIEIKLPEIFEDLKNVLEKAGFADADAKIVLAAATNLMEVVVTKKLQDLRASTSGKLNAKIERVIDEIGKKEKRKIDHQLISFTIKATRDKLDHEGFKLFVGNMDAGFFLKRTIDFMRQLYPQ